MLRDRDRDRHGHRRDQPRLVQSTEQKWNCGIDIAHFRTGIFVKRWKPHRDLEPLAELQPTNEPPVVGRFGFHARVGKRAGFDFLSVELRCYNQIFGAHRPLDRHHCERSILDCEECPIANSNFGKCDSNYQFDFDRSKYRFRFAVVDLGHCPKFAADHSESPKDDHAREQKVVAHCRHLGRLFEQSRVGHWRRQWLGSVKQFRPWPDQWPIAPHRDSS